MKARPCVAGAARFAAAAALAAAALAAHAQSVSEATAESLLSSRASGALPPAGAASAPAPWRPRHQSLRVIELPDERPLGPPRRKHHALSWRNDTLSQALDKAGLTRVECHNRVRLPSRWRAGSAQDTRSGVEVQLQVGVGCSF